MTRLRSRPQRARSPRGRGSLAATMTRIRPGRARGPAPRALVHVKAVPAEVPARAAAVRHQLSDRSAGAAHPAALGSGLPLGESREFVVSHDQLTYLRIPEARDPGGGQQPARYRGWLDNRVRQSGTRTRLLATPAAVRRWRA
jgi:hypothetical protein